ncbi:hypothetical protein ACO1DI_12385 [Priestia sp. 40]|uniref:hypothetical protein n=1 Tax=Priestia sp. 40 TaxID=3394459 RepID=UPI003BF6BC6A
MREMNENIIELYRIFSAISVEALIEYGISEHAEDHGFYMSIHDRNNIKFESKRYQLQFTVLDGQFKVAYDYRNKLNVMDMENKIKFNGRKFVS